MYCDHDRMQSQCPDCAYVRALERGRTDLADPPERVRKPSPTIAGEDLLFEVRPGVRELVAAGEPIPPRLLELPRTGRIPQKTGQPVKKTPGTRRARP